MSEIWRFWYCLRYYGQFDIIIVILILYDTIRPEERDLCLFSPKTVRGLWQVKKNRFRYLRWHTNILAFLLAPKLDANLYLRSFFVNVTMQYCEFKNKTSVLTDLCSMVNISEVPMRSGGENSISMEAPDEYSARRSSSLMDSTCQGYRKVSLGNIYSFGPKSPDAWTPWRSVHEFMRCTSVP